MCYDFYATVEDTLQIDVDFQVTLHCGMEIYPPPLILPPPIRITNAGGRILNAGGRLSGGARLPNQTNPTQYI